MTAGRLLPLYTTIRISPERLAGMLLWGLVCGAMLGVLYDIFRISRVFLGVRYPSRAADALYEKPLPLLRRPVPRSPATGRHVVRAITRHTVIFLEDVLFGVMWGVTMTLLVYFTNDGQWRIMAPVGMVCGFLGYYLTLGRLVLSLSQGIVWLLRAILCYTVAALLLPFRLTAALWRHTVGALWHRHREAVRVRRAAAYHENTLRELTARAERGWLWEPAGKSQHKGGWQHAKTGKCQKNDDRLAQCQDLSDADPGLCHRLFCDQDDGEQQAEKGARRPPATDRRRPKRGRRPAV